ncbi:stereocilin [Ramlibacter sp. AN1015]|uniref:stereocilin n=1 Tax=Ramlibacter sp. AN1015 TaxID=3133428 RepID=UPI0030BF9A84
MATHPVEPEAPEEGGAEPPSAPNTTRLPIEPEFLPDWSPAEPEDPGAKPQLP